MTRDHTHHHQAPVSAGAHDFKGDRMNAGTSVALEEVRKLATELSTPADPNYQDEWEKGYDAGREAAGRELAELLQRMGFME